MPTSLGVLSHLMAAEGGHVVEQSEHRFRRFQSATAAAITEIRPKTRHWVRVKVEGRSHAVIMSQFKSVINRQC